MITTQKVIPWIVAIMFKHWFQEKEYGYVHYWGGTKRDTDSLGVQNLDKIVKRVQQEVPEVWTVVEQLHQHFNKR